MIDISLMLLSIPTSVSFCLRFWPENFQNFLVVAPGVTLLEKNELKSTDPFGSVDLPVGGKSTDPQSGWMDDDGRVLVHHRPSIY